MSCRWGSVFVMLAAATPAVSAPLAPHRAVYDLSLATQSADLLAVEARIAFDLKTPECGTYDLDYRFVARFGQEGEVTLTDQRTVAREAWNGSDFDFQTWTFVDGLEQGDVKGRARTSEERTSVEMESPVERRFELPASRFPLGHTAHLIERARAGERIVQSPLYDGDEEGENLLTTTAVISPLGREQERPGEVDGLAGWKVDESYFNADSDADGLPIFHTRYTLYENGVSDDLYMDFGNYALKGRLSEITMGDAPQNCG